jgi:hypothetical protein
VWPPSPHRPLAAQLIPFQAELNATSNSARHLPEQAAPASAFGGNTRPDVRSAVRCSVEDGNDGAGLAMWGMGKGSCRSRHLLKHPTTPRRFGACKLAVAAHAVQVPPLQRTGATVTASGKLCPASSGDQRQNLRPCFKGVAKTAGCFAFKPEPFDPPSANENHEFESILRMRLARCSLMSLWRGTG